MHSSSFASPKQLRERWPLKPIQQQFILDSRKEVHNILTGHDPRLMIIVGPCSIHDIKGAQEYARRLKRLSETVSSSFMVIMRSYIEKPRTALGWKGLVHDPFLDGSHRIDLGYEMAREFLMHLVEMRLPSACEFLDPSLFIYNGDLITWGCIGARTSTSQVHRQLASDLAMPVAFKNSTDGNIENAVNGCLAATYPHAFLSLNEEGTLEIRNSPGNSDAHIVLRGGENKPNYDAESIRSARQFLHNAGLPERVIVDCSHDNCDKNYDQQQIVFADVMQQAFMENSPIRGLMVESYLNAGNQPLAGGLHRLHFGISITDPCLSWQVTEELILAAHYEFQKVNTLCRLKIQ